MHCSISFTFKTVEQRQLSWHIEAKMLISSVSYWEITELWGNCNLHQMEVYSTYEKDRLTAVPRASPRVHPLWFPGRSELEGALHALKEWGLSMRKKKSTKCGSIWQLLYLCSIEKSFYFELLILIWSIVSTQFFLQWSCQSPAYASECRGRWSSQEFIVPEGRWNHHQNSESRGQMSS